jgi:hypothetical protein
MTRSTVRTDTLARFAMSAFGSRGFVAQDDLPVCDLIDDQEPDGYVGRWCCACFDREARGGMFADPKEPLRVILGRREDETARGGS